MMAAQREQEASRIADFRYGIIAELANPYLGREERRRLLYEKSRVLYEVPGRGAKTLAFPRIHGHCSMPLASRRHPVEGVS